MFGKLASFKIIVHLVELDIMPTDLLHMKAVPGMPIRVQHVLQEPPACLQIVDSVISVLGGNIKVELAKVTAIRVRLANTLQVLAQIMQMTVYIAPQARSVPLVLHARLALQARRQTLLTQRVISVAPTNIHPLSRTRARPAGRAITPPVPIQESMARPAAMPVPPENTAPLH